MAFFAAEARDSVAHGEFFRLDAFNAMGRICSPPLSLRIGYAISIGNNCLGNTLIHLVEGESAPRDLEIDIARGEFIL